MFSWRREAPVDKELEELRESIFEELKVAETTDENYPQMLAALEKVYAIRARSRKPRAKPDTWLMAGAHVVGILAIIMFERKNPWTTKALNQGSFTKLQR
jgi:hypothetical protein